MRAGAGNRAVVGCSRCAGGWPCPEGGWPYLEGVGPCGEGGGGTESCHDVLKWFSPLREA